MSLYEAKAGEFHGEKAIWLQAGAYQAAILPEVGGNLIAFRDVERGFKFLREPDAAEMEAFKEAPAAYGIPVLFPPNRYEDGEFPWNGQTYQFPVNEAGNNNHIHGFVHKAVWSVEDYGSRAEESFVVVAIHVNRDHPAYQYFPHSFTIRLRYTLSKDGLSQHLFIKNEGTASMPCLLAFHTAVNAPFTVESSPEDCLVKLTIGQRWEMNERTLPTGNFLPLQPEEESLKNEGINPFFASLDNHYTAVPQNGRNRMELQDKRLGLTLIYDVGTSYKQWMIWNNQTTGGFFCPEPQINLINAPKSQLPAEEIGLFGLEPGEIWEETARLYIKATIR